MGGEDHSVTKEKEKSPSVRPQDHLTWPHNVCVGGGYYLFGDSASPYSLTPTETLQWANIKQGLMKLELIWALKVCETCLGTKGRLSAWEQAKGISFSSHRLPCVFLIDRPRPHLIEMTCSWQGAPAIQVDRLSAGKLSPIWFMKKFDGGLIHHKDSARWRVQFTADRTCTGKVQHVGSALYAPASHENVKNNQDYSTNIVKCQLLMDC